MPRGLGEIDQKESQELFTTYDVSASTCAVHRKGGQAHCVGPKRGKAGGYRPRAGQGECYFLRVKCGKVCACQIQTGAWQAGSLPD